MLRKAPTPEEVFTPRSHDLNQKTYAERLNLQNRLKRALRGHKYIIIHGESGNGKTWLYKKVLQDDGIPFEIINLAKMHTEGSFDGVILSKLGEIGTDVPSGTKKEFDLAARPGGFGGGYKDISEFKSLQPNPLELLARRLNMTSGGKLSVIALDNFEQIIGNEEFVRQVASVIITADEEFVVRNKIKIMLVGTPTNIRDLISKVSHATTIANRVVEIPEVARMELGEAMYVMSQGLEKHLNLTFLVDKNALYKNIAHKTDRIAQHVQELCLKISQNATDNGGRITDRVVLDSEREWIEETLSADLAIVESHMNAQKTKVGRKNQVIYCLGTLEDEDFTHHTVETKLRAMFPASQPANLNIPQTLAGFAKSDTPLIRKSAAKGSRYRFCSPKLKMVIRTRLKMDHDNNIIRTA